jgi:hypothetical protein
MEIVGKKNLELTKRALQSHLIRCSQHSLRSPDKVAEEKWDPEITATNQLLDAVEINLKREPGPEGAGSGIAEPSDQHHHRDKSAFFQG